MIETTDNVDVVEINFDAFTLIHSLFKRSELISAATVTVLGSGPTRRTPIAHAPDKIRLFHTLNIVLVEK